MNHPRIDQIIKENGEPVAYRSGKRWFHLDWTEDTHRTLPTDRERLGFGECGVVWRDGGEAVKGTYAKGRTTQEGEIYRLLQGTEGVANGRQFGNEIRTPLFANVISKHTVKRPQRLLFGPLVRWNLTRIESALRGLSDIGYDYYDSLQFGVGDKAEFHLLDFSAARKSDNAAAANQQRLIDFLEDFLGMMDRPAAFCEANCKHWEGRCMFAATRKRPCALPVDQFIYRRDKVIAEFRIGKTWYKPDWTEKPAPPIPDPTSGGCCG